MGAVTRDSVLYSNVFTNSFVADARDRAGRAVPLPFEHTVVAGELIGDIVNLTEIPFGAEVVGLELVTDGIVSTLEIGDAALTDRLMLATNLTAAETHGILAFAGMRFRPVGPASTVVFGTWSVANPGAGGIFKGRLWIIPGA